MHHHIQNQHRAAPPLTSLLIASCAIVGLAYWLGATWLANRVLGVPGGLWAVAVVFAAIRWGERLVLDSWFFTARSKGSRIAGFFREHLPVVTSPLAALPHRVASAARGAQEGWCAKTNEPNKPISYGISELHDGPRPSAARSRTTPIRVGIDLNDHLATRLMKGPSPIRVDWMPLRNALRNQELWSLHRIDAVVHSQGDMIIATPTQPRPLEPVWADWAEPIAPIGYASVFPMRIDAARICLGETSFTDPVDRDLAATLIDANIELRHAPISIARSHGATAPAHIPMRHLAQMIRENEQEYNLLPSFRTACRVVTAWLAVHPVDWSDDEILGTIQATTRTLSEEPEALLRAAAVRFVLGEDETGLATVAAADELLQRTPERLSHESQLPFVQSELNMGGDDPLAFGRIAAALCLCAAHANVDEIAFMRDDLLDEARFTEWLIGRDDERLVLMQVFRALERNRSQGVISHAA